MNFEIEELAIHILGIDENATTDLIDEELYNKFGVDLDNFSNILDKILPMMDIGTSQLSGETFIGLSDKENYRWIVKKDFSADMTNRVIAWCGDGELLGKEQKGFIKTVHKGGEPEFEIEIRHAK